jgi:hypothetical protein
MEGEKATRKKSFADHATWLSPTRKKRRIRGQRERCLPPFRSSSFAFFSLFVSLSNATQPTSSLLFCVIHVFFLIL